MLKSLLKLAGVAALATAVPAQAQIETVDPNQVTGGYQPDANNQPRYPDTPPSTADDWAPVDPGSQDTSGDQSWATPIDNGAPADSTDNGAYAVPADPWAPPAGPAAAPGQQTAQAQGDARVPRDDVISAAEGVFGRGARGLGQLLENILSEQGEPVAYITGQEAGGAFVIGVRYGSGIMHHQIEGDRQVYWTGPSIGFDAGADANKVFVLVYNLHDSQDLFRSYPAAEGHAYFVGGFNAQYMRRGDVVLIPVRLGVGVRLGINAGYMRFSERNRWLPF